MKARRPFKRTEAAITASTSPRLTVVKTTEPAGRTAGVVLGSVDELVGKLKEAGVLSTLLIADHTNSALRDATAKALTAAVALGGDIHVLVAGKDCGGAADAAANLRVPPRSCWPTMQPSTTSWQRRWPT